MRPVPVPDDVSTPFWAAAADGALVLATCCACDRATHPPTPVCPHCGTTEPAYRFEPAPGSGVVRSWTVLRQAFLPGFDVPYVLVDVALDGHDDLRLIGRLLGDASPHLGDTVAVAFDDGVPAFRLA